MMWPSRKQWKNWSLPSKLTALGVGIGIIGIALTIFLYGIDKLNNRQLTNLEFENSIERITSKLERIEEVVGIYSNVDTGVVVLIGKGSGKIPIPLTPEDIAFSIRLAKMSTTKTTASPFYGCLFEETGDGAMNVVFSGGLKNSHLGLVLFKADLALKKYSLGIMTGSASFQTSLDMSGKILNRLFTSSKEAVAGRLWLNGKPVVYTNPSNSLATINEVGVSIRAEESDTNKGRHAPNMRLNESPLHTLARVFTTSFVALSAEEQSFAAFTRIVQIVAVSKWLANSRILDEIEWVDAYVKKDETKTPTQIPKIQIISEQARKGKHDLRLSSVIQIEGGVTLPYRSTEFKRTTNPFMQEVEQIMDKLESYKLGTGSSFQFRTLGNSYLGIVLYAR